MAAAWPQAAWPQEQQAKRPKLPPGTILVNDVHAKLSSARVFQIVQPETLDEVRKAFALAKAEERAICIAGGRHSMGGQPFVADGVLIDTRKLNRVLFLDTGRGLLEVESGVTWPQILEHLVAAQRGSEKQWTFAQKQSGADRFTIGGCLSANIHGSGLTLPPFIADVESFKLLTARGNLVQCSRSDNPELFRLAIGGYGLFGFVYAVTLRLVARRKLERLVEIRDAKGLGEVFVERIRDGCLYGDFQCSVDDRSPEFLRRGVLSCYRPVADDAPIALAPRQLYGADWLEQLYLAHTDKAEAFRRLSSHYHSASGEIAWSDELQMSFYADNYHRQLDRRFASPHRGTESMAEIYCELGALEAFLADAAATARREKFEIIQGSVRLIERDTESFLAWARKPYACVSFHVHVDHTTSGSIRAGDAFRRLIDLGIRYGGSYYPTYHRYALRRQVEACFPQFADFLKLKRKYDPAELFQSDWYRHYRRMFFGG